MKLGKAVITAVAVVAAFLLFCAIIAVVIFAVDILASPQ